MLYVSILTASVLTAADDGHILTGSQLTLSEIDRMSAEVPPIDYSPRPLRWRYLPRTQERLTGGGTLRVVMLGDRIVNDTSRSTWELVLEKRHPACTIEKVTSVPGSTGCW